MVGFDTFKATTTFKVEDRDMTEEEYIKLFKESEIKARWEHTEGEYRLFAQELLELAQRFKPNDILEKRGNEIQMR